MQVGQKGPQFCACGCKKEVSPTCFYVRTNGDFLATRECWEKYENSHKPVYAPQQVQS